ncbi:MAG TPA: SURF1 family cytochrome oxidase biogenesis protein [Solimonas sp.]|nr:SURF1 family cytochrome oxidase biogenesis protein [Solimonas sp.]
MSGRYILQLVLAAVVLLGAAGASVSYGLKQRAAAAVSAGELALYEGAETREPLKITGQTVAAEGEVERALVIGRFDGGRQLLVPRELADGRKGYDVWASLVYNSIALNSSGELVMVNRGWITEEAKADPTSMQLPDGAMEIAGYWVSIPVSDENELARDTCLEPTWPKISTKVDPSFEDIKCLYNSQQIAQGVLLLSSNLGGSQLRDWTAQLAAMQKHQQTMSMLGFGGAGAALLLLVLFAIMSRPRGGAAPTATAPTAEAGAHQHDRHHPHAPLGKLQR